MYFRKKITLLLFFILFFFLSDNCTGVRIVSYTYGVLCGGNLRSDYYTLTTGLIFERYMYGGQKNYINYTSLSCVLETGSNKTIINPRISKSILFGLFRKLKLNPVNIPNIWIEILPVVSVGTCIEIDRENNNKAVLGFQPEAGLMIKSYGNGMKMILCYGYNIWQREVAEFGHNIFGLSVIINSNVFKKTKKKQ